MHVDETALKLLVHESSEQRAGLIALYVQECWQHRIGAVHAELPPQGSVVDGSDATT